MTWQQIVFGILQTVVFGMAVFYLKRAQEKRDTAAGGHAAAQKQAELLQLEMIWANNKLSYACAMALKRGHANGEGEDALLAYNAAREKYSAFLREQAIGQLQEA